MSEEKRQSKGNTTLIKRFTDIDEDHEAGSGEFEELFHESLKEIQVGEVVTGTVVQVNPDIVLVDVGYKSEGCVYTFEFTNEDGEVTVKPGDQVRVVVLRGENEKGYVVLSKRKAEERVGWENIATAGGEGGII